MSKIPITSFKNSSTASSRQEGVDTTKTENEINAVPGPSHNPTFTSLYPSTQSPLKKAFTEYINTQGTWEKLAVHVPGTKTRNLQKQINKFDKYNYNPFIKGNHKNTTDINARIQKIKRLDKKNILEDSIKTTQALVSLKKQQKKFLKKNKNPSLEELSTLRHELDVAGRFLEKLPSAPNEKTNKPLKNPPPKVKKNDITSSEKHTPSFIHDNVNTIAVSARSYLTIHMTIRLETMRDALSQPNTSPSLGELLAFHHELDTAERILEGLEPDETYKALKTQILSQLPQHIETELQTMRDTLSKPNTPLSMEELSQFRHNLDTADRILEGLEPGENYKALKEEILSQLEKHIEAGLKTITNTLSKSDPPLSMAELSGFRHALDAADQILEGLEPGKNYKALKTQILSQLPQHIETGLQTITNTLSKSDASLSMEELSGFRHNLDAADWVLDRLPSGQNPPAPSPLKEKVVDARAHLFTKTLEALGRDQEALKEKAKKANSPSTLGSGATNTTYQAKVGKTNETIVLKPEQTQRGRATVDQIIGLPHNTPNYGLRNDAVCKMAYALGWPKSVVLSTRVENIQILQNQKEKTVIVMERAPGKSAYQVFHKKITLEPEQAKRYLNAPELRKQMVTLQLLDYIIGGPDRHADNMFIDETDGKFRVTGIDNDAAFGINTTNISDTIGWAGFFDKQQIPIPFPKEWEGFLETNFRNKELTIDMLKKTCADEALFRMKKDLYEKTLSNIIRPYLPDSQSVKPFIQDILWNRKIDIEKPPRKISDILSKLDPSTQQEISSLITEARLFFSDKKTQNELIANKKRYAVRFNQLTEKGREILSAMRAQLTTQYQELYSRRGNHGVFLPPVISWSQYYSIVSLNEAQIREITQGLKEEEVQATLSRVESLKTHCAILKRQDAIIDDADWGSQKVTDRLFPKAWANGNTQNVLATTYLQRELYYEVPKLLEHSS